MDSARSLTPLRLAKDATRSHPTLGIWAAPTEGAKFWLTILTKLKNRGIEDIFFICADGLTGLDEAVEASFPRAVMPTVSRTSFERRYASCRGRTARSQRQYERRALTKATTYSTSKDRPSTIRYPLGFLVWTR
jgi:transposase-like protein